LQLKCKWTQRPRPRPDHRLGPLCWSLVYPRPLPSWGEGLLHIFSSIAAKFGLYMTDNNVDQPGRFSPWRPPIVTISYFRSFPIPHDIAFRKCQVAVASGTSTQPSHPMNGHLVLPVAVSMTRALPSYPSGNPGFYPFRALEIRNLVLNLVRIRRVFFLTPSSSGFPLKHTHRCPLVEGAQGTAANGKWLMPATTSHRPYQTSLCSSSSTYTPVTPGGLTSQ
jgi:hypothetical protein